MMDQPADTLKRFAFRDMQQSIERVARMQNDLTGVAGLTSARRLHDFHQEMTKLGEEQARAAADAREAQSAAGCVRRLEAQNASLNPNSTPTTMSGFAS